MSVSDSVITNNRQLTVIHCPDVDDRRKIHDYLDHKQPDLEHISVLIDAKSYDRKTLKKCYDCDKYVPLSYRYGYMENNQDEYYIGTCEKCDETVEWEPNYDDYDDVLKINDNNCIIVGDRGIINFGKNNNIYTNYSTTEEKYQSILSQCEKWNIDVGDNIWKAHIGGRKGKKCWNNKKRDLAKYVLEKISQCDQTQHNINI